jgi:hypothetical protein
MEKFSVLKFSNINKVKNPVKQLQQNEFNNETNLTIKVSQNYWTPQDHDLNMI